MRLPTLIDYQQAVQVPQLSFVDEALRGGQPQLNPLGAPRVASGGFALTFDVDAGGRRFAVRCFHKHGEHLQERYAQIGRFVSGPGLDVLVEVQFVPSGIRVDGVVYPIVRMPWVEGARLGDWIEDHLKDTHAIASVRRQIAEGVETLRQRGAAHGDLQHGNILVAAGNAVRFIDYDGMYLPELAHLGASEQGHPNYQHPGRAGRYDASLDLFAAQVIDLSLEAVGHEPALFADFNSGENLILSAADFVDPAASAVFARLARIPAVADRSRRLAAACTVDYATMPEVLAGSVPLPTASPASTRPAAGAAPAGPPMLAATDRVRLLARLGDTVTVVGRVRDVRMITRRGQITFINFGDYHRGDFTVVAWDRGSRQLASHFGDVASLEREWIAVTGMVTAYQSKRAPQPTPQIELRSVQALRKVSAAEAQRLLHRDAGPASVPRQRPTTSAHSTPPSSPSPSSAAADDLTQRLGRLYSKPGMTAATRQTAPPEPTSSSPPPPPFRKPAPPPFRKPAPPPSKAAPPPQVPPPQFYVHPPQFYAPPPQHGWVPPQRLRTALPSGIGVGAMLLSLCLAPAGLILGVVVLSHRQGVAETDRTCAKIAVGLGGLFTLVWLCTVTKGFTSI